MSQFEYIAVFVSIIAGLGVVHLLGGVASLPCICGRHKVLSLCDVDCRRLVAFLHPLQSIKS